MNKSSEDRSSMNSEVQEHLQSGEKKRESDLKKQIHYFQGITNTNRFLDVISDNVVVLNQDLKVVYANQAFFRFCGQNAPQVYGGKLGEIVNCEFADIEPGGCGASQFCEFCQVLDTIRRTRDTSQKQESACSISLKGWEALEFMLRAAPYPTEIGEFICLSLKDISNLHRREALERIFLHDILNTAGGMRGLAEMLSEGEDMEELREHVLHCTNELIDEIEAQRMLLSAETGKLETHRQSVSSDAILRSIQKRYLNHEIARGKTLTTPNDADSFYFQSDPTLLKRILSNMIKNAFEASSKGDSISLTARKTDDCISFEVHNPSVMSREVQLRLFRRSFSTKGSARGLGTYSIRLLGEKYLGGSVGFESEKGKGTIFRITLPRYSE